MPCRAVPCRLGAAAAQPPLRCLAAGGGTGKNLASLPGTALSEGEPTPPAAWARPGLSAFGLVWSQGRERDGGEEGKAKRGGGMDGVLTGQHEGNAEVSPRMAIRWATSPGQHFYLKDGPREERRLKEPSLQKRCAKSLIQKRRESHQLCSPEDSVQKRVFLPDQKALGHWGTKASALPPVAGYRQGRVFSGD